MATVKNEEINTTFMEKINQIMNTNKEVVGSWEKLKNGKSQAAD